MRASVVVWAIWFFVVPVKLTGAFDDQKSACVQKRGNVSIEAAYWVYATDTFWNACGKRRSAYNDFTIQEYWIYAEYGLTCRDTLSVKGSWARIEESVNGRTFGFEDLEVGWKHCFGMRWGHLFSVELVGIVPVASGYEPGLRYGEYGGECSFLFSREISFWSRWARYDVRMGYRGYSGFPSDQMLADGVLHFFLFPRLLISAGGHVEYGLWNGSSRTDESLFLFNPNYRLFRGQVQAKVYLSTRFSVFAGYRRHLWGRSVGTGGGMYGGAQLQF